ncbi:hypothetical protein OG948_38235 (plasmid) [Embleya sp. NBC_00888]|uniref:hypothetical protein n=1 Tax=Embleya sp. NBC_00888 TaxID=2975960 RepID=UPI002F914E53|nr:hypothetical protein OG948_38235 [Embleya sp. NBC_00888]
MLRLWMRHESRRTERRAALVPEDARELIARGVHLTVEESSQRVFPAHEYADAGCTIAPQGSWVSNCPTTDYVLGLKELPDEPAELIHRRIFFGHSYKGQPQAPRLLRRFEAGGGTLLDLEHLLDARGRRIVAFGYWAGYAGAALAVLRHRGGSSSSNPTATGAHSHRGSLAPVAGDDPWCRLSVMVHSPTLPAPGLDRVIRTWFRGGGDGGRPFQAPPRPVEVPRLPHDYAHAFHDHPLRGCPGGGFRCSSRPRACRRRVRAAVTALAIRAFFPAAAGAAGDGAAAGTNGAPPRRLWSTVTPIQTAPRRANPHHAT